MSDTQDIRKALEEILTGATGLPAKIAFENMKINPSEEDTWLRTKLMISESKAAAVGTGNAVLWRGLLLVDCFGKQNKGPAAVDQLADSILDLFPYGTQITENGKIINIRHAERSGAFQDDPWYICPVTITWYCYVA